MGTMSHVIHIAKNKKLLQTRFDIIKGIREFFWSKNFVEVETPTIVRHAGMEPNIAAMKLDIHNEHSVLFTGYLHTSPEYTMKKMLSAGFEKIFYLGKTFRDHESFGGLHNPEFTMLEWYRVGSTMFDVMRDVEELLQFVEGRVERKEGRDLVFRRLCMREVWEKFVQVDLDEYLDKEKMYGLCRKKRYNVKEDESYEELFYRIFLDEIEPKLKDLGAVIIHHYPAQMAALSRLSAEDLRYAERFEVYIDGIEIANAFSELTDADEQLRRFKTEQEERRRQGKEVYNIDYEFVESLKTMPESAGIALGVDRFVQALIGVENIEDILPLSMKQIFPT